MELESLLRDLIKPELNKIYTERPSRRGGGDMGLFCKEHAFHCMVLCQMLGHNAMIKRGDLTFQVSEPTTHTSFGMDTDHAWCEVDDIVPVDLSITFEYYQTTLPNIDLVYGSGQRGPYSISYTTDAAAYERCVDRRVSEDFTFPYIDYLESETIAIAVSELLDDPHRFLIEPPRNGLAALFGKQIFNAINLHLYEMANGRSKRLTTYRDAMSTMRTIGRRFPDATNKVKSILRISA